jgi:hypothetical protein
MVETEKMHNDNRIYVYFNLKTHPKVYKNMKTLINSDAEGNLFRNVL